MEQIRTLTEEEMPQSVELIHFAFKCANGLEDPLIRCRPEDTLGYFMDGQLASNIVILPLQVFIHGRTFEMGLIAGVASWPEYRKSGTIRKLMLEGLRLMKGKGQLISYLGPFSFSFYRKFGWEMMYEYKLYSLQKRSVPDWSGSGSIVRIPPDIARLNRIYEKYAIRFNGMLKRSETRWRSSILRNKKGWAAIYINESGEDRGYMLFDYADSELVIHELAYLDQEAWYGLWAYIRRQDSMFESVRFKAPANDQFPYLIDNPKGLEIKVVPHLMARIVHLSEFIRQFPFLSAKAGTKLILRVTDEQAPWNDGAFRLSFDPRGKPEVSLIETVGEDDKVLPDVICDIGTLSSLFMGYQRPSFLHQISRLQGSREAVEILEGIIPNRVPYYEDFGY